MAQFYLTLIETGANQRYIFGSNRLREIVGASELLYRVGTYWVLEAVRGREEAQRLLGPSPTPEKMREFICNGNENPPIEGTSDPGAVEIVVATSGKALLLTQTRERAREIVTFATENALKEAPGVTVVGATVPLAGATSGDLHNAIVAVHDRHQLLRNLLPGPEARFQRVPMTDECSSTGLPASIIDGEAPDARMEIVSDLAMVKRRARERGWQRTRDVLGHADLPLADNIEDIEKPEVPWVAIVHADGNGFGQLFLSFHEHAGLGDGVSLEAYVKKYRSFSFALDDCAVRAAGLAIQSTWGKAADKALIVPLVFGGDDLTAVCEGARALEFAETYVKGFEEESAKPGIVGDIAEAAFGVRRLCASAGVAVVKPHFPFHRAYELSGQLTESAKKTKAIMTRESGGDGQPVPVSSLDFHVLFDSSGADLRRIRRRLIVDDGDASLSAGPFVVTALEEIEAVPKALAWADRHHWGRLKEAVSALGQKDPEGRSLLPRSQQHALREAAFLGREIANGRLMAIRPRYGGGAADDPGFKWRTIAVEEATATGDQRDDTEPHLSLFYPDPMPLPPEDRSPEDEPNWRTHFIDALTLADIRSLIDDKIPSDEGSKHD